MPAREYSDATWNSANPLKRWSHGTRFEVALGLLDLETTDRFCDFGAGDGHLLRTIIERGLCDDLSAYDPFPMPGLIALVSANPAIALSTQYEDMPEGAFSAMACLETLEHFDEPHLQQMAKAIVRLLAPGGRLAVSVPIEVGPPSLVKNVVRLASGTAHAGTDAGSIVDALLAKPHLREKAISESGYIESHVGSDYRKVARAFEPLLPRVKTAYSPLPYGGALLNSQVFFVFQADA